MARHDQPALRARADDRLAELRFDAPAARLGVGLMISGAGLPVNGVDFAVCARGCSATKLRFNASIKLMTFCADGAEPTLLAGTRACFSRSFSTRTVR